LKKRRLHFVKSYDKSSAIDRYKIHLEIKLAKEKKNEQGIFYQMDAFLE